MSASQAVQVGAGIVTHCAEALGVGGKALPLL
jgi:hypothetical protein